MRLIDADKIEYTHAIARCIEDGHNWNELCVTKDDIEEEPTVDAVPVIRCKDCKFHHDRTQCKKRIGAWFDDDYCNGAVRAERKEENGK